ncbi:hydroxyacid dehydrogenase [Glaciihabitans sp. INWT7]|uniref:NAD(P)-dependent oxidoreductase n=1 Tax=Glaciihabitans sp. INWT7 TaxID=2596912 RepID=UPI001629980B|nr:NAD(P)-dependent oxidoreductase [Glaciihabitans sp. INWT7]QNE45575.1 hydroxyacid dehydrogenase [Glaciihabitans sp. INWT7]
MTFLIAVPDAAMLDRLTPAGEGVEIIVWTTDDPPLDRPIDLLVLPYSVSAEALPRLAASRVSLVQSQALGYNGVAEVLPPGIRYANAVGVHEGPTAELAVGLILDSQRGLDVMARAQPAGLWKRDWYPGLLGSAVLIVGVGGVGAAIEKRLAPFDVDITRVARTARTDALGTIHSLGELPDLLPLADIVVIAVPLTAETTNMVDGPFLGRMKAGALLVNVSRGAIVDTDALTERTRSGAIRAAVDVIEPEPLPADHPLWKTPGVIITPHIGGNISSMPSRVDPLVREQIRRLHEHHEPLNIVVDKRTGI